MADNLAEEILRRQSRMETDRVNWESHWREVGELVLPRQNDFQGANQTQGAKRTEKIFDGTAPLALERFASAVDSLITPAGETWHGMMPEDQGLMSDQESLLYCEEVTKLLFVARYRPAANFPAQMHECWVTLGAFGTPIMFTDDADGMPTYRSIPLVECYIAENAAGMVDLVHRKFQLSARQVAQKFPGAKLPESIMKATQVEPMRMFDFLHCVYPNDERVPGKRDYTGMAFRSAYYSYEGKMVVSEGGYRTMPYAVSRYVTAPREIYGRSPAMMVLPDIKMLNEMEKTIIRAAHRVVDPPLLLYSEGILAPFSTRPNALNYGGLNSSGQQMVKALDTGANVGLGVDLSDKRRALINDAFLVSLFQILVDTPRMSATEAMLRAQEKGQLLAPTMGRQQTEMIGTIIPREIDILSASGRLPPPPRQLLDSRGSLAVTYTSPLSRLRRAGEAVSILRTIEQIGPMVQFQPDVLDTFDPDAVVREIAEVNGVPVKVLRSVKEVMKIRKDRETQVQQTQALEASKTASEAAKNLSSAAQTAGYVNTPPGIQ